MSTLPKTKTLRSSSAQLHAGYKHYRQTLNAPIIERDAISRGKKLPSQKQFKDLANLIACIETTDALAFVYGRKLNEALEMREIIKRKLKLKYERQPERALQDPQTFTINNNVRRLRASKKSTDALCLSLRLAYKELAREDYKPKADVNKPLKLSA